MLLEILRLPLNNNNRFRDWDCIHRYSTFDFNDYELVYDDANSNLENPEQVFSLFNSENRPADFKGSSLSVSDIVKLGDRYYFCDEVGFKDITDEILSNEKFGKLIRCARIEEDFVNYITGAKIPESYNEKQKEIFIAADRKLENLMDTKKAQRYSFIDRFVERVAEKVAELEIEVEVEIEDEEEKEEYNDAPTKDEQYENLENDDISMYEDKYSFINETVNEKGHNLYRIKAKKDFGNVKAGELGGLIEAKNNLSQKGNCWVDYYSKVSGSAQVKENAYIANSTVKDNAEIKGGAIIENNAVIGGDVIVEGKTIIGGKVTINEGQLKNARICLEGE